MIVSALMVGLSQLVCLGNHIDMMIIHQNKTSDEELIKHSPWYLCLESDIEGRSPSCQQSAGGAALLQANHIKQHIIL